MHVTICAVGRLRSGPEKSLIDDYLTRFERTGRAVGLASGGVNEVEDRQGKGVETEAALLRRAVPEGAVLCVLDERGKALTSPEFANKLERWRDDGTANLAFLIGGADGVHPDLRTEADFQLSFGKMVWPHLLVRVMLAEQIYRAATILAGGPYHRA